VFLYSIIAEEIYFTSEALTSEAIYEMKTPTGTLFITGTLKYLLTIFLFIVLLFWAYEKKKTIIP